MFHDFCEDPKAHRGLKLKWFNKLPTEKKYDVSFSKNCLLYPLMPKMTKSIMSFWLRRRSPTSPNVCQSVSVSVCVWTVDISHYKTVPDSTRQYNTEQDSTRQYKTVQDSARQCKTVQDSARQCKTVQDRK